MLSFQKTRLYPTLFTFFSVYFLLTVLPLSLLVPETAPFIRNIESSSPDTVEVSWAPPQFPGGPILGYNLRLISKNQKLDSGTQRTSFQFYSTLPNTTYR